MHKTSGSSGIATVTIPVEALQSSEPVETGEPVEPVKGVETGEPVELVEPVEPVEPATISTTTLTCDCVNCDEQVAVTFCIQCRDKICDTHLQVNIFLLKKVRRH